MKRTTKNWKWYTDGANSIKVIEGEQIPEGYHLGRTFNPNPWNKGLKACEDDRVKLNTTKCHQTRKEKNNYQAWNKGLTKEIDSRVRGHSGEKNGMYGKHPKAWNKGLTKDNDKRVEKISQSRIGQPAWNEGLSKESDARLKNISETAQLSERQLKRYETMKKNKTLGVNSNTKAEQVVYNYLLNYYKEEDILKQYVDEYRFPYRCDFYIKSKDLFIEVQGNWTHGSHPYNSNSEEDMKKLEEWKNKALTSDYYKKAIYVWTDLDVRKTIIAKENNLNYIPIYFKGKEPINLEQLI